ncbi:MAG: crotonobetainyl-CoA:carnitine CoA-transferase CaiB-like acyl-CoA transferase [Candidatus Azotimanducaceae bacterium]|jgi:crotonobetainyl-CoA:carnitine CoA-transferase CaiB-like acyl-CoA transferase
MKPLAGMTVLEFSTMITASFAAMMMAEQGARVIKIEPVGMGDPMRYIGTQKGGISALFANCNRGKEAISVNLKDEVGQALVHRLVETADVVIHNFRPGVMEGLNLGSEKLRAINPRLVYMAISGFGKEGPLKNAPAYDPVIQAHAGFTASQGKHGPSGDAPAFVRNLMCDKITAYTAIQGVTAALLLRERDGLGQHIDLSMLDSGLFFIFPDGFMNNTLMDDDIQIQPLLSDLLYELTITKDGAITISAGTDQQRNNLLRALGLEALSEDERFSTLDALLQNFQAYRDILAVKFLQFTSDDILAKLRKWDVPAAKCHTYEEVLMQPQIDANDTIEVRHHPEMGSMRIIKSPVKFAGERLSPGQHSPTHGQHTITVLKELGLDDLTIESYKQDGVI